LEGPPIDVSVGRKQDLGIGSRISRGSLSSSIIGECPGARPEGFVLQQGVRRLSGGVSPANEDVAVNADLRSPDVRITETERLRLCFQVAMTTTEVELTGI
jgi:hypothetical protein